MNYKDYPKGYFLFFKCISCFYVIQFIYMNSDESFLKKLDTELATGRNTGDGTTRGVLHQEKLPPIADDWDVPKPEDFTDEVIVKKRTTQKNFFKKMFIGSIVFVFISAGFFIFSLFTGRARLTGENVGVTVNAKTFADSGEEVNVKVSITNQNAVPMELAKLIFSYPLGTVRDPNAAKETTRELGTIGAGETREELFTIQLFGEQGTEKSLNAMVEYRLQGSNAIFEKTNLAKLTLRSSLATLVATAPDTLLPGQELPVQLVISGNTTSTVTNALLVADYPDGCNYVSSDIAPTLDKNVWFLGDLAAGTQKQIGLVLSCTGVTDAEKNIVFTLGNQDPSNERIVSSVYTSTTHLVKLSSAFLATTILVNGKPFDSTVSIPQNRETMIDIDWKSTVDTPTTDAKIKLAFSGGAFDPTKLRSSNGYFNSADNTVTWTSNEVPALKTIQPNQSGRLSVTVIPRSGLTNSATLDTAVTVDGVLFGGKQSTLVNATTAKIPVITDLQLIPKVLHYSGPIQNTGTLPLSVGKETTFTVVWQIANSTNLVNGVVVKTTLPTGITWSNVVAPSANAANITYNTVTREVLWNVGDVPVGQDAKSIAFKLAITPSTSQINTVPKLTNDIALIGTDTVTNTPISQSKRALDTHLVGDTSTVGADGKVIK